MKKFRWFLLRTPASLQQVVRKLRATPLHEERSYGFTSMPNEVKARSSLRHLVKSSIRITAIDEEGRTEEREVDTLDAIDFYLFETAAGIWMCVENPPRSLRDLLTNIELVLGWGLSIAPAVLSLDQQRLALATGDSFKMIAFKGLGSSPRHKAVARVEVASKEGLEPEKLEFLAGLEFRIDHATFEVAKDFLKGQVSFAATGLVRIAGPLTPFLVAAVERQLTAGEPQ